MLRRKPSKIQVQIEDKEELVEARKHSLAVAAAAAAAATATTSTGAAYLNNQLDRNKDPSSKHQRIEQEVVNENLGPRKPRVLIAASGSVAAIKFGHLLHSFSDWAEIKAVVTKSSLHFIDKASIPKGVVIYTDEEEWSSWKKIGDNVLHIELRKWADVMVIAPLSANTLGKIAGGLCDNLLTCIVRAWDFSKPLFVAPAMNTYMWNNPFTQRHLDAISELGISLVHPITKRLACGDYGNGAMAEPSVIYSTVMLAVGSQAQTSDNVVSQ